MGAKDEFRKIKRQTYGAQMLRRLAWHGEAGLESSSKQRRGSPYC